MFNLKDEEYINTNIFLFGNNRFVNVNPAFIYKWNNRLCFIVEEMEFFSICAPFGMAPKPPF